MKLKDCFITHELDGSQVMVNASNEQSSFNGLVKSNETAGFIISLLKEDKTEEDLVKALLDEYDVDEATAKEAVEYVLSKLKEIDALN